MKLAFERGSKQTTAMTIESGLKTFASLIVCTMPLVVSWGTVVLIIANSPLIFQIISYPFAWLLSLVKIPEAEDVGRTRVSTGTADQFLAAVVGSARTAVAAKFICSCASGTGLIYMTEVGVLIELIYHSNFVKLTVIYLIRAMLSIFLLAPFLWWFC